MTVFHALAHERRREILALLRDRDMTVGEVTAHFEVTQPAISQHLKVLSDAGLVTRRNEGTRHLFRARPEGLEELQDFLAGFFEEGLARLKAAAEAEERSGAPDARSN
jgi:DNA-binding transcriptional ArsR family regulator